MTQIIGYARTSTTDQVAGLEAQIRDLKAAGCQQVFREQVSSVVERAQLDKALSVVGEGDTLMVTKPDRLARSTVDLLAIEIDLSKRGVGMVILSMGGERLDTRNPTSKLILTILGGVATWEREIMLERQREGVAKARAEGKYRGAKPTDPEIVDSVRTARQSGINNSQIALTLGITERHVRKIVARYIRIDVNGIAHSVSSICANEQALAA